VKPCIDRSPGTLGWLGLEAAAGQIPPYESSDASGGSMRLAPHRGAPAAHHAPRDRAGELVDALRVSTLRGRLRLASMKARRHSCVLASGRHVIGLPDSVGWASLPQWALPGPRGRHRPGAGLRCLTGEASEQARRPVPPK
jgi:hypothetical protein